MNEVLRKFVEDYSITMEALEQVVEKMNFNKDDEIHKFALLGILERQLRDFLIVCVIKNCDPKELKEFEKKCADPLFNNKNFSKEDKLLSYFADDEELVKRCAPEVDEFLKNFVERYNELVA